MHILVAVLGILIFIFRMMSKASKESAQRNTNTRYRSARILPPPMVKELPVESPPLENLPTNHVNFDRLGTFIYRPRTYYGAFKSIVGEFQGESEKWKWIEEIAQIPLIYYSILQAPRYLYYPGYRENITVIIIYAENEENQRDLEWLKNTTTRIQQLHKDSGMLGNANEEIQTFLQNTQSTKIPFCIPIPSNLSDGAQAWCTLHTIEKQKDLPLQFLPDEQILPAFLRSASTGQLYDIPAKHYQ